LFTSITADFYRIGKLAYVGPYIGTLFVFFFSTFMEVAVADYSDIRRIIDHRLVGLGLTEASNTTIEMESIFR